MSFQGLSYDPCSYEQKLKTSVAPGMYMLGTPANDCTDCGRDIPADPSMRWQHWGPGMCAPGSAVGVESDLFGIPRKNTKCPSKQYLPGNNPEAPSVCAAPSKSVPVRSCMAPREDTRLSNPPCTLRGTGWNRWEWLCYNPQDKAIIPFEWNVSYRNVVKDNHKPCLPSPLNQDAFMPSGAPMAVTTQTNVTTGWMPPTGCGAEAPGNPYEVRYTSCP